MDCSEKRPFICERSASRLQTRNLQERLPKELTNDFTQSLPILKADLNSELGVTISELENFFGDLIQIPTPLSIADSTALGRVIGAVSVLKSRCSALLHSSVDCNNLMTTNNKVLTSIETLLQRESALPANLSEMQTVGALQHFAKKLQKRHLEIQSSLLKIC